MNRGAGSSAAFGEHVAPDPASLVVGLLGPALASAVARSQTVIGTCQPS
jgi:hypothetical protein